MENESLTITAPEATASSKGILVLDDEDDIIAIFKKSLLREGFSVTGFTDSLLALEHFRNNSDNYELVLTDIRMRQMNGIEFASQVRRLNPTVKILVMSAYELNDLNLEPSLHITEVLQKPLSPTQLRRAVSKYMVS
jgi:CheY-like chemotaxis protein